MSDSIRFAPRLAGLAIMTLLMLALAPVALAHTELEGSSPADGDTVASPFDGPIVMTFSEALADGSKADLLDRAGESIASAEVDGPGAKMTIALDDVLDPGDYEVTWTGIAADGHVERGTIAFTVAPAPPTASPSARPTPSPTASSAPATPSPEPTITASPAPPSPEPTVPGDATTGGDVVLPIIVSLIVVGAGAVYLLSRRNRPGAPA